MRIKIFIFLFSVLYFFPIFSFAQSSSSSSSDILNYSLRERDLSIDQFVKQTENIIRGIFKTYGQVRLPDQIQDLKEYLPQLELQEVSAQEKDKRLGSITLKDILSGFKELIIFLMRLVLLVFIVMVQVLKGLLGWLG
ncbi:MAG: hypothetical protein HYW77_01655 [Parcubacteria group bacterium]|nr:hypothetical protein [Parcubacteria group bacterium]